MDIPLDINELSSVSKLIPSFNGNKEEINWFLASLEIVNAGIATTKQKSLFSFVFNTKLDDMVQNRVKQISVPTNISKLLINLRQAYKPKKSPNVLLNELTSIVQLQDTIKKFAIKIETLVSELNEVQIANLGEESREIVTKSNSVIAFNSFKNGLKDREIIKTIEASRVKTFAEAVAIAEETSSDISQNQIMFQHAHYNSNISANNYMRYRNDGNFRNNYNRNGSYNNNVSYNNNGGNYNNNNGRNNYNNGSNYNNGNNSYRGINHQNNSRNGQNLNGNNHRGNNYNGRGQRNFRMNNRGNGGNYNGRSYGNRNQQINHIQEQGNSENPETVTYAESPEENQ